jgi:hypothetical protein
MLTGGLPVIIPPNKNNIAMLLFYIKVQSIVNKISVQPTKLLVAFSDN